MAAGMNYGEQIILGDYPCDIQSIVRYRGGFNLHAEAITKYNGYIFEPLTPMWVNLTTREAYPVPTGFETNPPSTTVDTDTNYIVFALLYNRLKVEEGATVTLILRANEVLFTGLEAMTYTDATGAKSFVTTYADLSTIEANRSAVKEKLPYCTFCWA